MPQGTFECRWAFLGLSGIAEKFLLDLLLPRDTSKSIRHQLVAVSTTGPKERARRWLAEQASANAEDIVIYTSYEAMLKSGEFDIVYISTPHSVHFEHARAAIENKRHVLLEKPAVMNQKQYQRLSELAKKNDVVLMEGMWTRYFPLTKHLQQHIVPKLGAIKRVLADYSVPIFDDPAMDASARFLKKSTGAGSLLDLGVYPLTWIDIVLSSVSEATESATPVQVVFANTIEHDTPFEPIDDVTTVILSRPSPAFTGVVTISSSLPGSASLGLDDKLLRKKNAPSIRVQGTKAEVSIPFPPIRPETLTVQYYSPEALDEAGFETEEIVTKEVHGWGLWYQADVIAEAVRERLAREEATGSGTVIGEQGTVRVQGWMDEAKKRAGIQYSEELERLW
ncbi:MAG: hypothetical protein Q9190_001270 [Brigantiaea leucoxantha]